MEYGLVLWWLVAYLALMFVGMPLAAVLFPRLADRGAGFALAVALALLWVVVYLVGHLSLTLGLWVGLAALGVATGVATYRGVAVDRRRYGEVAAVFTLAFLFLVAVRAVDPAVHAAGGEKFLDFGLLNSILRTDRLPPEDMWFAGQPVQYYYGGHLLAAVLTRITGTAPRYAYNLALAGFYATLVTAAYGLAGSVAASRGVSRRRAGAFGAVLVGFASNLSTAVALGLWLVPMPVRRPLTGALGIELEGVVAGGPAAFSYWSASRVIDGTINEFPLFAWLNGDLHAHMMSTPFVLLVAGLCFSYFRTPASDRRRRLLLVFGAVPPLAGLLAVVNTWSFPIVGGLVFLTLALAPTDPASLLPGDLATRVPDSGAVHELARHALALGGAGVVAVLGVVWSLPFWLGTASGRSIGFLPERSSMGALVLVHGAFLLVFAVYLTRQGLPALDREHADEVVVLLVLGAVLAWGGASAPVVALLGPILVVGWILMRTQLGSAGPGSAAGVDVSPDPVSDGGVAVAGDAAGPDDGSGVGDRLGGVVGFETLLILAGAGVVFIVEFAFVQEQAGPGRLNTVFKTYADVWILWAVAAGAALAHLVGVDADVPDLALTGERWRTAFQVLTVALVVSTSIYGAFALSDHFSASGGFYNDPENPSLDALRFVDERHPAEAQAIAWFDDLDGQPNMVSKPGTDMYSWDANPVASLTGVPTLAGWAHEVGYRDRGVYRTRVDHANAIYTGSPEVRAYYLRAYEVEYVYVGAAERGAYGTSDLETFESMSGVTLATQWEDVRVYRVTHEDLPETGD
jgi:YYY domain-containing protein